jgi:predicted MFS family arabinose efflux permease
MALLSRPFSGYLVDTFDRKKVLMWCFFLFFIFFAGYLAASTLLLFTIVRTLHGAPFGSVTVANSTMAIDVLPASRRNEGIGYYGLSNNLAMAIAPTAGLLLYHETRNFQLLFWLALVIAGIGMAVDATIKNQPALNSKTQKLKNSKNLIRLDRFFLTNGWMLAVNMVFFGFCFGVLSNYLAIYCKEVMGRTGGTGVYFALLSVGLIASRLQGSKGLREGKLSRNAAEGVILSALGYTLFVACPNDFGYYTSALLIGLGNGHMWPAFQNMIINVANHNQRGTANSTILVSWDVGMGLGVLIGGVASEYLGYVEAFWIAASVQIMGTLLFLMKTRGFFEARRIR